MPTSLPNARQDLITAINDLLLEKQHGLAHNLIDALTIIDNVNKALDGGERMGLTQKRSVT